MQPIDLVDYLRQSWPQVAERYSDAVLDGLAQRYAEPHRRYHSTKHIVELLQKLQKFKSHATSPENIAHAILWHDAVYNTNQPDSVNVQASASLFLETPAGLSAVLKQRIAHMIKATDGHSLNVMPHHRSWYNDTALFLDLDLSPLAADADVFNQNGEDIAFEYQQYSASQFATGRAQFLESYAEKPQLFFHPVTREQYEERARVNMRRAALQWRQRVADLAHDQPQ